MTALTLDPGPARIPGEFGRLDAKFPVSLRLLSAYGSLPDAPSLVQRQQFLGVVWGMLGNDTVGDCTFAGYVHLVMAIALLLGVSITVPQASAVVHDYLTFTHGVDAGAAESDVLQAGYATGLCGFKLAGYAKGVGGIDEMERIIFSGGAVYLGGMMTQSDQQRFAEGLPWDVTSDTNIVGGHAFVGVEYDRAAAMAKVLTWGAEQLVTYAWLEARIDEQWMPLPQIIKDAGSLNGFDWDLLEADLHALVGAVG